MDGKRIPDLRRHLDDLRTGTHGGAVSRSDKLARFRREVDLLDPYVRQALQELDEGWLAGTGQTTRTDSDQDPEAELVTRWSLTWPDQRAAGVPPVQVLARFAGQVHPHLGATRARDWPMHVDDETEAARHLPLLRLLVESELHQRVFEADWRIVTGYRQERE